MDSDRDQVHLLVNYPPKVAVSALVNSLKGASSRVLQKERPDVAQRSYHKGVLWSLNYFATFCGGAPISIVRQYIEQQQMPDERPNPRMPAASALSISPMNGGAFPASR